MGHCHSNLIVVFVGLDADKEEEIKEQREKRKAKTLTAVSAMSSGRMLIGNTKVGGPQILEKTGGTARC
jgi:hypothetical protein